MSERFSRDEDFRLSLVVPMYNESEACEPFFERVLPIVSSVTEDFEIVCVNDGSDDDTEEKLLAKSARDPRIKVINLSRNFGKEVALSAGIDFATGDAVIPIDCDLQDPPDLIPEMVRRWRAGADTVFAIRADRHSDSYFKRTTAALFYKVIGRLSHVSIPANSGDFRLMDRAVADALMALPERNRFMKGLYAWVGYRADAIEFTRPARVAGDSSRVSFPSPPRRCASGPISASSSPPFRPSTACSSSCGRSFKASMCRATRPCWSPCCF
jgi:glycosyltransferase involved in cell wall biosynthesis